ncbi:MAG: hypothetical protein WBW79_09720 [Desulfocapsaceae bacterium]
MGDICSLKNLLESEAAHIHLNERIMRGPGLVDKHMAAEIKTDDIDPRIEQGGGNDSGTAA